MVRIMVLAHRHADWPGQVPRVPGHGRPAQGGLGPPSPQAFVRPNQALRRFPRQGPPAVGGRPAQGDLVPPTDRGRIMYYPQSG